MHKFFISPLICLTLILALPLPLRTEESDITMISHLPLSLSINSPSHFGEMANFLEQLSHFNENESSVLRAMNNKIMSGESIFKDDIIEALAHAQSVIAEYSDEIGADQAEHIDGMFNVIDRYS